MWSVAFDFDGVLCDSSREVFVVAVDTYAGMESGSGLADRLRPLRDDALAGGDEFRADDRYHRFLDLLPLGNRAEDFGASLAAMEADAPITDQASYDAYFEKLDPQWLERFHRLFYQQRAALRAADRQAWIELHLPYPELAGILRGHRGSHDLAVVTAKDARSVEVLLEALGFAGIFGPDRILDKEAGVAKTEHLRTLRERSGIDFTRMTFIDDKLNHLRTIEPLGVRPVLAAWGFNSEREHRAAAELGLEIATLDSAAEILFRGAGE